MVIFGVLQRTFLTDLARGDTELLPPLPERFEANLRAVFDWYMPWCQGHGRVPSYTHTHHSHGGPVQVRCRF